MRVCLSTPSLLSVHVGVVLTSRTGRGRTAVCQREVCFPTNHETDEYSSAIRFAPSTRGFVFVTTSSGSAIRFSPRGCSLSTEKRNHFDCQALLLEDSRWPEIRRCMYVSPSAEPVCVDTSETWFLLPDCWETVRLASVCRHRLRFDVWGTRLFSAICLPS